MLFTTVLLKISQLAISQKPLNQKEIPLENIFLHLSTDFGLKIENIEMFELF